MTITINKARKILGIEGEKLRDEEIQETINAASLLADIAIDTFKKMTPEEKHTLTRKRLDTIFKEREKYPYDDPSKFTSAFFPEFKNKLELVSPPPAKDNQYNCFAFSLGLTIWVHKNVIINAISAGDLTETAIPKPGDIAIYRRANEPKDSYLSIQHAGIFSEDGKIISKWAGGPVFKHDVLFAPYSYGEIVEYYDGIDAEKGKLIFNKFSKKPPQNV